MPLARLSEQIMKVYCYKKLRGWIVVTEDEKFYAEGRTQKEAIENALIRSA